MRIWCRVFGRRGACQTDGQQPLCRNEQEAEQLRQLLEGHLQRLQEDRRYALLWKRRGKRMLRWKN